MAEKMLRTWENIGKCLNMSKSSVMRKYKASLATEDTMPVHKCNGICGGVVRAFPKDLLAWKERESDRLYSIKEMAIFLGMSTMTLYRKRQIEGKRGNTFPISKGVSNKKALKEWMFRQ
jgi:predicted DNA-binding transcriptional regulator AlpA